MTQPQQTDELTETEIVNKLSEGWALRCGINGWHLESPRKPYQRTKSHSVPESLVEALHAKGTITYAEGHWSTSAILTDHNKDDA
ncbi:SH3 domain-containing protein [Ferrimonas marina]|uniref:Uncharacterized protein n=1 Tax=Ferrimonas marina TaxID=299255 RepID=A0A1M5TYV1_9GAMM|nr:hypothetical protein [Ferrimonas marina]SHH55919.1 hypothetical protein SAMN02745129_2335 [Ferrimonas marina]